MKWFCNEAASTLLVVAVISFGMLSGASEVRAQEKAAGLNSPTSEQAKKIEAMVNKAAALVEAKGKAAAFAEFRKRDSEWWFGNTYLFSYDKDMNVLLNTAFP